MFINQTVFTDSVVPFFHKSSIFRRVAKQVLPGFTIKQSFHGGTICLDAVEHSWAWTGNRRYETFDHNLQNKLLLLSQQNELLIDIGANIGAMTLSVLMRNQNISAVSVDPNTRALKLLNHSAHINKIERRVQTIEAVVSDKDGELSFDETGSVTGHISNSGKRVKSVAFAGLINQYSSRKCLIKIDVEGFETHLFRYLQKIQDRRNICLVVELHPLGFNNVGNPSECLDLLRASGADIRGIDDCLLEHVKDNNFTQAIARWS